MQNEFDETTCYFCKDCVFSKVHWVEKFFRFGIFEIPSSEYKCTKFPDMDFTSRSDFMVTGPKKYQKFESCRYARMQDNMCGPSGKHWRPSNKKDMVKFLQRGSHD
jgi:hypothetical protein